MKIYVVAVVISLIYLIFKTKTNLHMLQQNFYNENNRYIKWLIKNKKVVTIDILSLLLVGIGIILGDRILGLLIGLFYIVLISVTLTHMKNEQVKIPLKYTARIYRLIITISILYIVPIILLIINYNSIISYTVLCLLIIFNSIIIYLANILNKPIEKIVYLKYKNMASKKLKNMTNLDVIGITGSYGKTSSKNILNTILNEKYNAMTTPKNFNTQYGLMITINNHIDKFCDFFVAEMGAFTTGRIKLLCDFVKPKYGILTKIGTAHLETFGSQENIQKTKFELIESLPQDGVGVLNKDDELQVSYKLKNNCEIIWVSLKDKTADVYADNIKITNKGMSFDCHFKNDKNKYTFETKLLGIPNVYNIISSIALGHRLGMSIKELQLGTKKLKSVEHRLELKKYKDVTIIDDAYNSNPVGAKMALDVLNLMDGKKVIVTPGMIELGNEEYKLNKIFGTQIAEICDEVILVGEKQTKAIQEGLKEKKYNENNVHIINDVKEAFTIIDNIKKENTYVLLENDLPDIFNERKK